ncbi:MAG: tetraacyldisaccharide 4'-kinase, partial [Chthoniobacterales bacterium]
ILTRGYRGDQANGMPADEVALFRERLGGNVQLGIGKNRYESGRILERHGAKWFILDDGFQHLALERDANIVLLDGKNPFVGGMLLPAGRLREPLDALRRADVVVITRSDRAPAVESILRKHSEAPVFYAQTELENVLRAPQLAVELPIRDWPAARVFAFCGIGNPRSFFEDLCTWRFQVLGERSFRDHHRYSPAELESLEAAARKVGADALICTEKDVFNLPPGKVGSFPVYACRIRMGLSNPAEFWKAVQSAIERHEKVKQS